MPDNSTQQVKDLIAPLVPSKWAWVTDERAVSKIDVVTCVLTPTTIIPEPSTGKLQTRVTYQLSIIQPGIDYAETEEPLFGNVQILLVGIRLIDRRAHPMARGLAWTSAKKAQWPDNGNLCWQIDLEVITEPKI